MGVECEHLAFRGHVTDWQLWIETGAKPVPRKYVNDQQDLVERRKIRCESGTGTRTHSGCDAFGLKHRRGYKVTWNPALWRKFDENSPGKHRSKSKKCLVTKTHHTGGGHCRAGAGLSWKRNERSTKVFGSPR